MNFRIVLILMLFLSFSAWPVHSEPRKESSSLYILNDGFIFAPENYSEEDIFEGGAWSLYYYLEQEIAVRPGIRKFLNGNQVILFRLFFREPGNLESIVPVERYYWYTIDGLAKSIVEDFISVLYKSNKWSDRFKGEVLFPLRFRSSGGRIAVDYNAFVTGGVGKVRIGKK